MRSVPREGCMTHRDRKAPGLALRHTARMTTLAAVAAILAPCASASAKGPPQRLPMRAGERQREAQSPSSRAHELGYSLTPSTTEPYLACGLPKPHHYACMAGIDPPGVGHKPSLPGAPSEQGLSTVSPNLEGSGELGGLSPSDLRSAYKISTTGGSGQTVAIVDAYDDPNAEADLKAYRSHYGLSECTKANGCFKRVNQKGEEANYPKKTIESWGLEMSLDLDMVSAMCQECHILLVEATNSETVNLDAAENEAATWEETGTKKKATEITDSWGTPEHSEETSEDSYFNHPGIPITVSSGDSGYGVSYPSASQYVISVGGTTLKKATSSRGWEETVWKGAGSGCSAYEPKPSWQTDPDCAKRTDADVSAVASNESPVSVYDTYEERPEEDGWLNVWGTSASAPIVAAIEAHSSSMVREQRAEAFYRHVLFDVSKGNNAEKCGGYLCNGEEGYDGPTGWGTPDGPIELSVGFRAITDPAMQVSAHATTLTGFIDPEGKEAGYWFEYGKTTSYGSRVPASNGSAGGAVVWHGVSQALTGLEFATSYHYRLVAIRGSETIYGQDHTLTTAAWTVQPTPEIEGPPCAAELFCHNLLSISCRSAAACMAVGDSATGGSANDLLSEYWNGIKWEIQSVPMPLHGEFGALYGVSCSVPTACAAVGEYSAAITQRALAESWNGTEWEVHSVPNPVGAEESWLESVSCSSPTECIAAGWYIDSAEEGRPLTESWNGAEWQILETPFPPATGQDEAALEGVSCTASNACTAVGWWYTPSKGTEPLAERWDGSWHIQTIPNPAGASATLLKSVSCVSSTECTAVGDWSKSFSEKWPFAEHWNGSGGGWEIQSVPNPTGVAGGQLEDVSCSSPTDCTAIGMPVYEVSEGEPLFAEHWNDAAWSVVPVAVPAGQDDLWGISCLSSGACIATGRSAGSVLVEREIVPTATTEPATEVKRSEGTLHGTVNPQEGDTHYYFEYGTTTSYGSKTAEVNAGSGGTNVHVSKTITGLTDTTAYHFRLVAANAVGTSYGEDQTFATEQWLFASSFGSQGTGNGQFSEVFGVAVDAEGHVWTTDSGNNRIEEFSASGEYIRQVKTEAFPYGITVDSKGDVWVTDSKANCVQEFSSTGTLITQFGSEGSGNGQFSYPMGIKIDSKGNVWVADADNARVQEFSSTGTFISKLGSGGTGNGQFETPTDVAFNAEGDMWVVDSNNSRLQEFSSVGAYIRSVGIWGAGNGQFELPRGITIDSEGHLFVTDFANGRVEELSSVGAYISQFGTTGSGAGQLHWPSSITADSSGHLWIADAFNNRVQKWQAAPSWQYLSSFGSQGTGNGQFSEVFGVAVDAEGHVWTTDSGNNRIEEFSASGEYIRQVKTEAFPYGITVDSKGDVWVTDSKANCVQEFSSTGTLITQFGSEGSGNGQFSYPMGIKIDSKGNVWVADADNARVQEFSSTGTFISKLGSGGTGNGQFETPTDVAFNAEGDMWVVDSNNSRLQEFSSVGAYIRSVGIWGAGNGQFELPRGITIDSEGHLFVTDFANGRVEELSSVGAYISQFGTTGSGAGQLHWPSSITADSSGHLWIADAFNNRVQKWVE